MNILSSAISRSRATICMLLLIIVAGIASRSAMVIEAFPNPSVPIVLVQLFQEGASPEDGARLLVRPIEQELRAIDGLKEIRATSRETVSYIIVEFEADQNIDQALLDVRAAVDRGKAKLPQAAEEPVVEEVSADDAPTIVLSVSGQAQERAVFQTAKLLKRTIEAMPSVLEVEMNGHSEEMIEIIIDPVKLEYYSITSGELFRAIQTNNVLIPAGQLDTGTGRFSVKIPSLIETREDVYNLPIRADENGIVRLGDITEVRRSFKDPWQHSAINGQRALTLNVKKRGTANDIEVSNAVRALATDLKSQIPEGVEVGFFLDQSEFSLGMIDEMQGNILTAMMLVLIVIVSALGIRSGLLVAAGVPFSLLFASIILLQLGYSFNFMVLFGMLLALGMLIDGAIVITEFADRKMAEGMSSRQAYQLSVKRMIWPVTASTSTTLAAFLPIMFWPGVAGEFMRYLPVTVFTVLVGSLFYALLFAPVVGALLGKNKMTKETETYLRQIETADPVTLSGITGRYARFLDNVVHHPFVFFCGAIFVLIAIFSAFSKHSKGTDFFVQTEQIQGTVSIRAQGNLAIDEARDLVAQVEERVMKVEGIKVVYTITSPGSPVQLGPREPEVDQIGIMLVETYKPEELGYSTMKIYDEIREVSQGIPGIIVNAAAMEGGPPVGKPIQVQITSHNRERLYAAADKLKAGLGSISGLRDITDTSPLPGIEWAIKVDRERAAQLGADVAEVGNFIQMVTAGVKIGEYRPDDADEEVDIRVRFPEAERKIHALDRLKVNTANGPVAISSFVERVAEKKIDKVQRVNGLEYITVLADVEPGVVADAKVQEITAWLAENPLDDAVTASFRGANEEQEKSFAFLGVAFSLALFLMFILLVTQFNSIYQAFLTLSSVILSTAGVLLGLIFTQELFSVIMTGVGIVALAGIVVNNNIVLIDTFNYLRRTRTELHVKEVAILAATQRLRPVFLTTFTTILGLLPLATGISIDLVNRTIIPGGVVGSFWVALASSIVHGLLFSTVLTLAVTPTMLILPAEFKSLFKRYIKIPLDKYRKAHTSSNPESEMAEEAVR